MEQMVLWLMEVWIDCIYWTGARTNLGLAMEKIRHRGDEGDNLDDIDELSVTDGNIIVGNGTKFVAESWV